MTVLVDTGVLYADHDRDASRHGSATNALETVYDGEFGQPYVSDFVFDEALTLTRRRTGSHADAMRLSDRIRGEGEYPAAYELIHLSVAGFSDALSVFERFGDQALSFTDATSIALIERHRIDGLLSFDTDFDGLVERIDPASM